MRIIVLNDHGSVTGGAAQVAIAGLNALANSGHDVTFVSSVGPVDPNIDRNRVKIHNFGFYDLLGNPSRLSAAMHGLLDLHCAGLFKDILKEYDPADTIIHLHTWIKSLTSSVIREAAKKDFKIVCTLHDYFSVCPNGGLYDYQKQQICTLEPMSYSCVLQNCDARNYGQKLWRVARQYVQQNFGGMPSKIDNFITISEFSERLLRPFLPSSAHFYRVNNPIGIPQDVPANPTTGDYFLFIGRFSPEKGGHIFSSAAREARVKARFVGKGEAEDMWRTGNPAAAFPGWKNREGIIQELRKSRALVLPSQCYETQGLVVLEAAALGVPAIVSDVCAARDYIKDGVSGLLFKAGDVDDLKQKLTLLDKNPELSLQLGNEAYSNYWSNPHSLDRHVGELLTCYTNILKNNSL